jgi:preprotein translocase subunit YajC
MEMLAILALAFGAMWLMTSRTRKQQKKAAAFRSNLAPGQEVMTGSGLFGTIVEVSEETVTIETSPGVTSRWLRPAIAKLVEPPVAEDEDADAEDEYEDDLEDDLSERPSGFLEDRSPTIPDDASSLTRDPGEDDSPRR